MNLLKTILNWKNNISLKNIINRKVRECELFKYHIPFMMQLVNNYNNLRFYKTDEAHKKFWIDIISKETNKTICINRDSIIIIGDEIDVILFRWNGLYDVVDIFNKGLDNTQLQRNIFLIRYDIKKYLSTLSDSYSKLIKTFPNIVINNDNVDIYEKIEPNNALLKGGKLVSIPIEKRLPITKITIYSDPSSSITSVKLNGKHPNADSNGWFCLGKLKKSPLDIDTIYKLIELVKCYKLDDCYWRPYGYKKW